jgi:SnoaL-like domain
MGTLERQTVRSGAVGLGAADLAAAQAYSGCLDVVQAFFAFVDGGRGGLAYRLFAPGGRMTRGDVSISGTELESALRARESDGIRRRHVAGVYSCCLTGAGQAVTETIYQLYLLGEPADGGSSGPLAPSGMTRLIDRFVRTASGTWRIAEREVRVLAGGSS